MSSRQHSRYWSQIARLELLQLWRSRMARVAVVGLLLLGAAAILHGASRAERVREDVMALEPELVEQARYLQRITAAEDDLGLLLYYLAVPVVREPSAWSPAAAGLRGVHPDSGHLRFTGLVPQLYRAEIGNPMAEHAGHFDLAFVIAFLLPLFIIALGYDARSRDVDLGTLAIVRSQPLRVSRLIGLRLALRAAAVSAAALALLGLAALVFRAPLDLRALVLVCAVLGYICSGFLVVFCVSSIGRSSPFNALVLCGGWIGRLCCCRRSSTSHRWRSGRSAEAWSSRWSSAWT